MSEAVIQRLKISREGVVLIKSFEGFRPRAIRRDDGQWVIGYGHTLSAREGATVSEADAELLLQYDLIPVAKAVNEGVSAPLNQHQFDALASFAFSVGVDRFQSSDVLSRLNAGFAGEAADAMINWPEPVVAETALRRRAAERALFVANPGAPVALADLLAAPLPPPYRGPVEPPVPTPVAPVEAEVPAEYLAPDLAQDAVQEPEQAAEQSPRQAAVAALLAEPAPVLHQPEPEAEAEAEPDIAHIEAPALETPAVEAPVEPVEAVEVAPEAPAPAPVPAAAFAANLPMQRYSAYAGAIVGPLPGAIRSPMANAFAPAPAPARAETPAAEPAPAPVAPEPASQAPVAEVPAAQVPAADVDVNPFALPRTEPAQAETAQTEAAEPAIEAPVEIPAEPAAEPAPEPAPPPWYVGEGPRAEAAAFAAPIAPNPFAASPFPEPAPAEAAPVEPLAEAEPDPFALVPPPVPAQPSPFDAAPARPEAPPFEVPVFGDPAAPAPAPAPDPWPAAISATSEPRTDGELLVLNGSPESEVFASPRLVWPHSEQSGDEAPALFEDDGSLRLAPGNILRHEVVEETPPARIPWGELAAYGVMGAFGLVSFGMSMAAFRRAADDSAGGDGVILIAVVLAVVGAACVGVSAYNLYRRWGRVDEE